uniref:Protein kinase domain-containing protein n=1 Tax=Streptomyces sp. NBC_00093 TaxID=2975649 RepID=A0AAU1ZWJ8_9ACTN
MTTTTISWVGRDRLGDLTAHRLGDGGQGVVYAVSDPPGRFAGEYLAYKEYLPTVSSDPEVLYELVCFFDELRRTDRYDHSFLDKRLTWPIALVYTGVRPTQPSPRANPGTTVTGFLMQRITEEFELDSARLGKVKPQGMEFLLNDDGFTGSLGLDVDDGRRLRLLIDLAATLNRLHRHRVAVGDLSPKNVLFMLDPSPKCLLIDCDSMRLAGKDVLPQVETDDWAVPEAAKATPASDTYKFGLIATRLFNRHQTSTDLSGLRTVSSGLANLAEQSRNSAPGARPPMEEWLRALEQARAHRKKPPPPPPTQRHRPPVTPPQQQPVTRPNTGFQFPQQAPQQHNQPTQPTPYTPCTPPQRAPQRTPGPSTRASRRPPVRSAWSWSC